VRDAAVSQARTRNAYSAIEMLLKAGAAVCRASCEVPVTRVPTGKVKLHQVSDEVP
jgi:hypothetical protein